MPKKSSQKQMQKRSSQQKNHRFPFTLKRLVLLISTGLIFFIVTRALLSTEQEQPDCANSKSCYSDLSVKIENNTSGIFEGKKVNPPHVNPSDTLNHAVSGANSTSSEKHIFVDLSTQTLVAYQGTSQILKTLVSTGRWGKTPTGNFHIYTKLRSTRMAGGEGDDAYDLPNVPHVMYFYHDFGLHGAYWHDNFGHTMSHGCVNLRQVDAKALYDWADGPKGETPGTEVSICDQITKTNQCIQNNPIQS